MAGFSVGDCSACGSSVDESPAPPPPLGSPGGLHNQCGRVQAVRRGGLPHPAGAAPGGDVPLHRAPGPGAPRGVCAGAWEGLWQQRLCAITRVSRVGGGVWRACLARAGVCGRLRRWCWGPHPLFRPPTQWQGALSCTPSAQSEWAVELPRRGSVRTALLCCPTRPPRCLSRRTTGASQGRPCRRPQAPWTACLGPWWRRCGVRWIWSVATGPPPPWCTWRGSAQVQAAWSVGDGG